MKQGNDGSLKFSSWEQKHIIVYIFVIKHVPKMGVFEMQMTGPLCFKGSSLDFGSWGGKPIFNSLCKKPVRATEIKRESARVELNPS